jgi:alpha-L-fucosidase
VAGVELLGSNEKLTWGLDGAGLKVKMPAQKPCDYAFALRITRKANAGKK